MKETNGLHGSISKNSSNVSGSVERNTVSFNNLKAQVEENTTNITSNTSTINDLVTKVQTLTTRVSNITTELLPVIQEKIDALKTYVDNKVFGLSVKVDAYKIEVSKKVDATEYESSIAQLNQKLAKKGCAMYYDASGELDPEGKSYWYMCSDKDNLTGSIIAGPYNFGTGGGGGGGGGGTSTVSINAVDWPSTVATGSDVSIKVLWSSTKSGTTTGNGTISLYVNGISKLVQKNTPQGIVTLYITDYIEEGTNSIEVRVADAYSSTDNVIQTITAVNVSIESGFNELKTFGANVDFDYTPHGEGVTKTIYFFADDVKVGEVVTASTEKQTFIFENLTHGSHWLKVYFTCDISGNIVTSNILYFNVICAIKGNKTPIISSSFRDLTQEQYNSFTIPYRVYTPDYVYSSVELYIDNVLQKSETVSEDIAYWNCKPTEYGTFVYSIRSGGQSFDLSIIVTESSIDVKPVTTNLALYLTSTGRSNTEIHRDIWEDADHGITCDLQNFNFKSDGWLLDDDNNTVMRVTGDARIVIPFKPFGSGDIASTGETIEFEFATKDIRDYETTLISCIDSDESFKKKCVLVDPTEDRNRGFAIDSFDSKVFKAKVVDKGTYTFIYKTNIWTLNDSAITLADYGISIKEIIITSEGTSTDYIYDDDKIIINYSDANRGFKLTPQLATLSSQQSELSTQYKEDDHIRLTFVVEKNTGLSEKQNTRIMSMYVNGIMCAATQYPLNDEFSQSVPAYISIGSSDATIDLYNIRVYSMALNRNQVVNNWVADTQSADLKRTRYLRNDNYENGEIVKTKLPNDIPYIIWDIDPLPQYKGDKRKGQAYYYEPLDQSRDFRLPTKDGVGQGDYNVQGTSSAGYPVKNIRLKSKDGFYDDNLILNDSFEITKGGIGVNYFTFKVDFASSEGANNVELTKLYNDEAKALGILTPPQKLNNKVRVGIDGYPIVAFHRDSDGNDTFCTKANFNNDKANEEVYGFIAGDESWEITNNSADEANFKKPATAETFSKAFEIRFPDEDGYSDLTHLGPMTEWVVSTDPDQATGDAITPISYTYTTVVMGEDGTYSTREVTTPTYTNDTAEYRKSKFKAELSNFFDVDSTVFYYIFTHLFLMVDSRAKNMFPTYFVSREEGDGGNHWFWLPYDMDTALGINNEGKLVFDYNLEDTDQVDGANVYNGQNSVIWNNLREMFKGEIGQMYANMRTSGSLISFENVENNFATHQDWWSEVIFNEDSYIKYIKPLIEDNENYLEMLQGDKSEQRRWWLYNRFKYFDSKYTAGEAIEDRIQFRAYGHGDVTIVPYADIYASVSYSNSEEDFISKRATRNTAVTLVNPLPATADDQETYIYSASQLKSVGDLSPFKPGTMDVSKAVKLQELKVGDGSIGYENLKLTSLTLGNNTLLRTLDVRNCPNLVQAVDISGCTNIEEVYFDNTGITSLSLPKAGVLRTLHLPDTITELNITNQPLLEELELAGTDNVKKLWLEGIPENVINAKKIITSMSAGSQVRLIGFKQEVETAEEIYSLFELLDTMSGMDGQGTRTDHVQIEGTIHIGAISYKDYVALTNWTLDGEQPYHQVTIDYDIMECDVRFYSYWEDGERKEQIGLTQQVIKGEAAVEPATPPVKPPTVETVYIFREWDKKFDKVLTDLDITGLFDSAVRQYTVKFNLQSSIPTPIPTQYINCYEKAVRPEDPVIPQATFIGWFTDPLLADTEYDFDTSVSEDKVLYAHWRDDADPTVSITRKKYNTFEITLEDNIEVTDYAITNTLTEDPLWVAIEPSTSYTKDIVITKAGDYYVWARDLYGRITTGSGIKLIQAYSISTKKAVGSDLSILEAGEAITANFALYQTPLDISIVKNEHYENYSLLINDAVVTDPDHIEITEDIVIRATCTPKNYTVKFDLGTEHTYTPIEDQIIEYNHLANKPLSQYDAGYITGDWYLDGIKWDFDTNKVDQDITLFGEWIAYSEPTKINVHLDEAQTVTCNCSQELSEGILVDWGVEGADTSKSTRTGTITFSYNYTEAGDYEIKIYFAKGTNNLLGWGNESYPVISPASIMTKVEFAYNMSTTNAYALAGANNITSINFTIFMNKLATGVCKNCTSLKTVYIPTTIVEIGNYAFNNCSNIESITIPKSVLRIGSYAFTNCVKLNKLTINEGVEQIGDRTFGACSALTEVILPSTLTSVGIATFIACTELSHIVFNNSYNTFGEYCFSGCSKLLTAGALGSDCNIEFAWEAEIPENAFHSSSLTSVTIPENILSIETRAFYSCSDLANVILPEALQELHKEAFRKCSKLYSIVLYDNITLIDAGAFWDCEHINIKALPLQLKTIGDGAFYNCYSSLFKESTETTIVRLPGNLTTIGKNAFQNCLAISGTLIVPPSVTDLENNVFIGCRNIDAVNLWVEQSSNLIGAPQNSWFYGFKQNAIIHYPVDVNYQTAYGPDFHYRDETNTLMITNDLNINTKEL